MEIGLIFCLCAVGILLICILAILGMYMKLKNSYDTLFESFRNLEELNSTLRVQRHDYLNHLQVVYGMTELQEYDELKKYLEPVYKDMMKTGKALKTSKPALNALLKAKSGEAESEHIDMYVEVKSDLKELNVPDWELCRILSNIIENGMTALKELPEDRKLSLDITESREEYIFSIANNGPQIEKDIQNEIFRRGFTTKKEKGHGMGLYIVSSTLKAYGGSIQVHSDEEETVFEICFAKLQTEM